jgi:hypothetical protein
LFPLQDAPISRLRQEQENEVQAVIATMKRRLGSAIDPDVLRRCDFIR